MAKILMQDYYKANDKMFWQPNPKADGVPIWRFDGNPLFDPRDHDDKYWHIYNSATIMVDGKYVGVFRCDTATGKPDLNMAYSDDGIHWTIDDETIKLYNPDGTRFEYLYAYDPRLIKIEDAYYVVFCADIEGPSVYIAKTTDFKYFEMIPGAFLPPNRNGTLFPEKVNGKYMALSRPFGDIAPGHIYISESPDMCYWGNHKLLMKKGQFPGSYWEQNKIGAGPAPIKTDEGWILIYHGVQHSCNGFIYSIGVAVLDLEDPSKVKYRANRFLMTPTEMYELTGFVPNVLFPCAALADTQGRVSIYYGAADSTLGIAFTTIDNLIEFAKKHNGQ